jgi:hypothetical protein
MALEGCKKVMQRIKLKAEKKSENWEETRLTFAETDWSVGGIAACGSEDDSSSE